MNETTTEPGMAEAAAADPGPRVDADANERIKQAIERDRLAAEADDETDELPTGDEAEAEDEADTAGEPPKAEAPTPRVAKLPANPPDDPRTDTCPICKGHGVVLTGSGVEGHSDRRCWRCTGAGYLELRTDPDDETERQSNWIAPTTSVY